MNDIDKNEIRKPYQVVIEGGEGEYVEKKSRFIATVQPVESEEEAVAFIDGIKKKYWDARHNCSAFVIGSKNEITRCSDDGEPSGTAGRPMLEVLLGQEVHNVAVVVTRYFGGVLLGTGGLVRAYTKAVQEGLMNSQIATLAFGTKVKIETDYNGIGKLQYILGKVGVPIGNSEYTDVVTLEVFLLQEQKDGILKEMTEATAGKCKFEEIESKYELLL